jgi:2-polyprenyl-6-methoxyphenol hydroxylase-like FAD-dependent oxidoreductase
MERGNAAGSARGLCICSCIRLSDCHLIPYPDKTLKHSDFQRILKNAAIRYGAQVYSHSLVSNVDPERRVVTLASGLSFRADVIIGADGPLGLSRRTFLEAEGKTDDDSSPTGMMMYK